MISEKSIICFLNYVSSEEAEAIAGDIAEALNQESIMIERQELEYYFFSAASK